MKKVLLIIPAYNEEESILKTVQRVEKYRETLKESSYQLDYIVINDGSSDQTAQILRKAQIPSLHLPLNLGIGGAVQTGYQYALKHQYDIAVQFDGDGQHDIHSLEKILAPIIQEESDFVIGSRFIPYAKSSFQTTQLRRLGIRFLSGLIKCLTGKKLYDVTSGFRAANRQVIAYFAEQYPLYFPEPESSVSLIKAGFRLSEVPVEMSDRLGGASSIRLKHSILYMLEVSVAILIVSLTGGKKQ